MLLDIECRIDFLQRVEAQPHPFVDAVRQHFHGVAHPRVGQADDPRPVIAMVEQIGAARQPVGQRHRHLVAPGDLVLVLPERPVGHHESLRRLHVAGAVERHPHLRRKQVLLDLDMRGQDPALHGDEAGFVQPRVAPAVGDGDLVAVSALDPGDARPGCSVMQLLERSAIWPMRHVPRRQFPQAPRHLLDAAHDIALVLVAVGGDDAENLQHRIGIIRIPAAGAEAHLAENLAVAIGLAGESIRGGDEIIEAAVVPDGDQPVPHRFQPRRVLVAHRLAELGEAGTFFQRLRPAFADLAEHRRQLPGVLDIEGFAFEIDNRRWRRRRQRIGKGFRFEAERVHIMIEAGGGLRKPHAAQFGDDAGRALEGLRLQTSADPSGFIDDGLQAHLHQLVSSGDACHPGADDRHLGAMPMGGNRAQPRRMFQPIVIGKGKIRAIHGHRFRGIGFGQEEMRWRRHGRKLLDADSGGKFNQIAEASS